MMAAFAAYIKTITALAVFSALVGLLLPEGKYRRYTELVLVRCLGCFMRRKREICP